MKKCSKMFLIICLGLYFCIGCKKRDRSSDKKENQGNEDLELEFEKMEMIDTVKKKTKLNENDSIFTTIHDDGHMISTAPQYQNINFIAQNENKDGNMKSESQDSDASLFRITKEEEEQSEKLHLMFQMQLKDRIEYHFKIEDFTQKNFVFHLPYEGFYNKMFRPKQSYGYGIEFYQKNSIFKFHLTHETTFDILEVIKVHEKNENRICTNPSKINLFVFVVEKKN